MDEILIRLSKSEALVLFEWLSRTETQNRPASFVDGAEQRVMWDLTAMLERQLQEPLSTRYDELLTLARAAVRDEAE